ncbi:hypothetical protein GLX30_34250 [Streptomyces sp. Tu 2975]|uniref:hypothetical protein n=1 Tax=Streptomyces sp. Tu 2975 TaxID=2676871 RepID=UPI00135A9160|nr:hypothetical protein [Streptomyces sp. Tu 2975]QIP88243.1 hypothetical protein GLX30_34250 [Streptomyces sp. Tu 2975]
MTIRQVSDDGNGDRDGAWAALFEAFTPSPGIAGAWLWGLGLNRAAPAEVLIRILDAGRADFLFRKDLPPGVLDAAVVHPVRRVWGTAAESGNLSPTQWGRLLAATADLPVHGLLAELAAEKSADRRPYAGVGIGRPPHPESQPPSTPTEIAAMADAVPATAPDDRTYALWWIAALHNDPDAMRLLASYPNLWIRRSVARARRLPQDVVRLLAHDEDRVVRLFLSESCDDAPADLLLDVWSWWSGSLSFPGRPRNHPNFPRSGLLRHADSPQPRMRLLALDDPASTGALVEQLSHDPDPCVRGRAAEDVRLSPESAARLTDDADHAVRRLARKHPALPRANVVPLLLDEHSAKDTAENPAIPATVMRRMVALAAAHA